MFGKKSTIPQIHQHSVVNSTVVNENRAPTDDSIKLVREYEDKARERIGDLIPTELNELKSTLFAQQDPYCFNTTLSMKLNINGVDRQFNYIVTDGDNISNELFVDFKNEMALFIAESFIIDNSTKLSETFTKLMRNH